MGRHYYRIPAHKLVERHNPDESVDAKNRATSAKQLRDLEHAQKEVLYLSSDMKTITTWTGDLAGRVTRLTRNRGGFGGRAGGFYNVRMVDIYGHHWAGTSPGGGMYARLRRVKGPSRKSAWDQIVGR